MLLLPAVLAGCAPARLGGDAGEKHSPFDGRVMTRRGAARDDAAEVLRLCGRPGSDRSATVQDALHHGPVRRLFYQGLRPVTLEFVPANDAPTPDAVRLWRFSVALMEDKQVLASERLKPWLPCAAEALGDEY